MMQRKIVDQNNQFSCDKQNLTKNEQRKMNDTKYPYAMGEPHASFSTLPVNGSQSPGKQSSIMLFQASPVAQLKKYNFLMCKKSFSIFSFLSKFKISFTGIAASVHPKKFGNYYAD